MELCAETVHLFWLQASVTEHANLLCDMRPVMLRTELLQMFHETLSHADDAVSHRLHFRTPTPTTAIERHQQRAGKSASVYHSEVSAGSERMVATMRAP